MKKTALLILAVLLWALPAAARETVRSFRQQIPLGTAGKIHLDFPVGEIRVEGWDNPQVGLDVKITCKELTRRCEEGARALRVVFNRDHGQLEIHVTDWPHMGAAKGLNVDAVMRVPRNLPLRADLGVGSLTIDGIAADVTADLGVGEVHVNLPKEAIGSANIDAGIGEASLVAAGRRYSSEGLIVRAIHWDKGLGHSRVKVDCGVGEIHVTLA
jgi:predicted small secreted protein